MQISWWPSSDYAYVFLLFHIFFKFSIGEKHILAGTFLSLGIFPGEYG
jgi:hypothetical protein